MLANVGNLIGYISDDESRSRATAAACFILAALLEALKDEVLAHVPVAVHDMEIVDSLLVGAAVSIGVLLLLASVRERRKRVRAELLRISELNHEVRNALQVLVDSQFDANPERREIVIASVDRINVVLTRLFPVVGGEPQP